MNLPQRQYKRQYVDVEVSFDAAGRMRPKTITWTDGAKFEIDRITDVRPAAAQKAGGQGDRYRIQVRGNSRELFFEHNPDMSSMCVGRWFVELKI